MKGRECDRCGIYVTPPRDARRLGVMLDGALTAERLLCLRCFDAALSAITDAVRRQVPSLPFSVTRPAR